VDENTVVVFKEPLTESMIEAGAELTRKLDEIGLPVTTALWFFNVEIREWRLLFASPEVDSKGPLVVYEKIQDAIDELGEKASEASMDVVGLLSENAELARLLRVGVDGGTGINRIRLKRNGIRGHYIEDALVYRAA